MAEDMNVVVLSGRLVRQPELRITPSGVSVTTATIAVNKYVRNNEGNSADFFDIVVWGTSAENLCKYGDKGSLIGVQGRLATRTYTTQEGSRRKVWEVEAKGWMFLGSRKRTDDSEPSDTPGGWDESDLR